MMQKQDNVIVLQDFLDQFVIKSAHLISMVVTVTKFALVRVILVIH